MRFQTLCLVGLLIWLPLVFVACQDRSETYTVRIDSSCQAVDDVGAITELKLRQGLNVRWCNDTAGEVNIEFSVEGVLPSGNRLVLAAGACEEAKVTSNVAAGAYEWFFGCQAGGGSGGGPVKVDPPTP